MSRVDSRHQQGFTIIELLLAMTFVSLLLMAIALTVMQITVLYQRGATLKEVDQTGRAISEDLQSTIGAAAPFDVGEGQAGGVAYRPQYRTGGTSGTAEGARLCTGGYSYIWNYGAHLGDPINQFADSDDELRLVKVRDNGAVYCADIDRAVVRAEAVDLLASGNVDVALQSFRITRVANDPVLQQALYYITLEVGTNDQAALKRSVEGLMTSDMACKPPSEEGANSDYCAVNKFEFTARAGNKGGE